MAKFIEVDDALCKFSKDLDDLLIAFEDEARLSDEEEKVGLTEDCSPVYLNCIVQDKAHSCLRWKSPTVKGER